MEILLSILAFIFGAALGSFLLVIADRYHTGLSFWKGRSFCFSCSHKLNFLDLVPFFSFIFLKGRCRYCGFKIPGEAFVVELLMGAFSVLAFMKSGLFVLPELTSLFLYVIYVLIFGVVILISIYDLRHYIIPDSFLIALLLLGFGLHLVLGFTVIYLLAGAMLCFPFAILFVISKGRWLGFGDVKYMFVIGFLLGPAEGLSAIIFAFWIGAVLSVTLVLLPKVLPRLGLPSLGRSFTMKSEIPFGPFLSLGVILSLIFHVDLFNLKILSDFFI